MMKWPLRLACAVLVVGFLHAWAVIEKPREDFAIGWLKLAVDNASVDEGLTTEKAIQLEPQGLNPSLSSWVITSAGALLDVRLTGKGKDKVLNSGRVLLTMAPRIRDELQFRDKSCHQRALIELDEGLKIYKKLAHLELSQLQKMLLLIKGSDEGQLLVKAQRAFEVWLQEIDLRFALQKKISDCQFNTAEQAMSENRSTEDSNPEYMNPVLRAPAKRWNGLLSVRLTSKVISKSVTGHFLLDSGAPRSLVSPLFFDAQGIRQSWVQKGTPRALSWTGGKGVGASANMGSVTLGGIAVPIQDFGILNTEIFSSSNFITHCCDGVVGMDFIKNHVIELISTQPSSLVVWGLTRFKPRTDFVGLSARVDPITLRIVSDCHLDNTEQLPVRIEWMTAQVEGVRILGKKRQKASLICGDVKILPATDLSERVQIGMPLILRSHVVFDLPHAKIWLQKSGLEFGLPQNNSGMSLSFRLNRFGERELRVEKIKNGSEAAKHLIQVGSRIITVNGQGAAQSDLWSIEQLLSGDTGQQVVLEVEPPLRSYLDDPDQKLVKKIVLQLPLVNN